MSEKDPNGIDPHNGGAKLDAGKNRLGLVLGDFANALYAVGEVGTFGANKYSASGWLKVPDATNRYRDAYLRHILKEMMGEQIDQDSGLLHSAHAAWNALALLEFKLREAKDKNVTN